MVILALPGIPAKIISPTAMGVKMVMIIIQGWAY